jgi:hypothetical protein
MPGAAQTPYVVRPHSASQTPQEQSCWNFHYPWSMPDKERTASLQSSPNPTFAAASGYGYGQYDPAIAAIVAQSQLGSTSGDVTIHGLLSTFIAVLFSEGNSHCKISTPPIDSRRECSPGSPHFPFRNSQRVPYGSNISVKMWRKASQGRVWYDWCAKGPRRSTARARPSGRLPFTILMEIK